MNVTGEYQEKVTQLVSRIKRTRAKNNNSLSIKPESELPNGLLDEFMSIANFSNPQNPFQDIGIRKRNATFRSSFKCLSITEDLYLILSNFNIKNF